MILGFKKKVKEEAWGCPTSCLHPSAFSLHEPIAYCNTQLHWRNQELIRKGDKTVLVLIRICLGEQHGEPPAASILLVSSGPPQDGSPGPAQPPAFVCWWA